MRPRLAALAAAGGAALVLATGAPAPAQTKPVGTSVAHLEVVRPLRTVTLATLQFGRATPAGRQGGTVTLTAAQPAVRTSLNATLLPGGTVSPLAIAVTGEPGRAYRILLPASAKSNPAGFLVGSFTVATRTSGVVTTVRQAQLDASGADTVFVGATLQLPKGAKADAYAAQVPVAISYE